MRGEAVTLEEAKKRRRVAHAFIFATSLLVVIVALNAFWPPTIMQAGGIACFGLLVAHVLDVVADRFWGKRV